MAIEDVARRVTYTGNGKQTDFSFSFVVFNAQTDIAVYRKASDDADEELVSANEYSVTLNSDQASNPGGKVTMTPAPDDGATIALLSNVAYEQTMELTTHDGFDPRTLNKNADRIVAMIQQLKENLARAVVVDATDTLTPAELKKKLVEAASAAYDVAMQQAELARGYAEQAKASEEKTAEYAEAATVIAPIADEVKTVAGAVESLGTVSENIEAVKTVAENVETVAGVADEMKVVVANVDAIKTVSGIADDVSTVSKSAEEITTVGQNIADVHNAAQLLPHADDIGAIKGHLDEVHKVGQDLLGVNSADFDCGEIGDKLDSITTVVDGYIKKVAEHIDDCIHPVGEDIEAVELVAMNLEPINQVAEVMTTDYEKIFTEGVY